jgi:hypothetical protein
MFTRQRGVSLSEENFSTMPLSRHTPSRCGPSHCGQSSAKHEPHATILHLMGLDHERLTFRFGGRDYRLTDVHGNVVKEILA